VLNISDTTIEYSKRNIDQTILSSGTVEKNKVCIYGWR